MNHSEADDPLEDLVARCLRDIETGDGSLLEQVCREHPDDAETIRERVRAIRDLGFADGAPWAQSLPVGDAEFPEKLGEFRLIRRLASGGMGVVYLAEQERLGREVALKLVRPEHLYFPGSRERFRREVEAVARLQHRGIVPIYSVGEDAGIPFFTMERIRGCMLADALAALGNRDPAELSGQDLELVVRGRAEATDENGSSTPRCWLFEGNWEQTCLRIAQRVAEAMQHAHDRGVLHRDIKPSNIAITVDGQAKVLDFGLALSAGDQHMTHTGSWVGSLLYLSPEQVRGERAAVGPHSDVYALGVTLYEALTLRSPFHDEDPSVTRRKILDGRPVAPRRHNRALSWEAETVCLAGMRPEPLRRYRSMVDYAADLANVLARRPIQMRRAGPLLRVQRWIQRHRTASLGIALLALAIPTLLWLQQRNANLALQVRLLDAIQIQALRSEADALYPATPSMVPRMDRWLAQAEPIARDLDRHAANLERLRAAVAARVDARDAARWEAELKALREQRAEAAKALAKWWRLIVAGLDEQIGELEHRRTEVARYVGEPSRQLELAALEGLARERVAFRKLVEEVRRRRAFAADVHRRTVLDLMPLWEQTRRAISGEPCYGGLVVEPQSGLIPIGQDPRSRLFEFADLATGQPAVRRDDGRLEVGEQTGIVLVLISGGAFDMGCSRELAERFEGKGVGGVLAEWDEAPVNRVELAPFFLSKYELTQAQWNRITGAWPSAYTHPWIEMLNIEVTLTNPVESVSWYDCKSMLRKIGMELPTEAQWEYAARGGKKKMLWWPGSTREELTAPRSPGSPVNSYLNVADFQFQNNGVAVPLGFTLHEEWLDDYQLVHAPVGRFPANPFGLHEILGNVGEWCRDQLGDYARPPQGSEGVFPSTLKLGRCYRGGSFMRTLAFCRSADRNQAWPGARMEDVGLRPMRRIEN